jgi:hypothetical protein
MSRWPARLAWWLCVVEVAAVLALVTSGPVSDDWSAAAAGLFIAAFAVTGALVTTRQPTNPVGWLLSAIALTFTSGGLSVAVSERAADDAGAAPPYEVAAAWVGTWVWMLGIGLAGTYALLLFPNGQLPSRRWRRLLPVPGIALAASVVALALMPGRIEDTRVDNPFGVGGDRDVFSVLYGVSSAVLLATFLISCASLVIRYRSSGTTQRQQLKWVAMSWPVVALAVGVSMFIEWRYDGDTAIALSNGVASLGLSAVPVSIGIAMLRHRLYDVDVVIRRTLVYSVLTAVLAATYLGLVLLLQQVLRPLTDESDLAVAASTLAVAAAFRPVRSRVQAAVDRRFYRRRYDAGQTLDSFAARLRHEVDLEAVGQDLSRTVRDAVQPAHVSVWLRGTPS